MQQNLNQTAHISGTTGDITTKFTVAMYAITSVGPVGFSDD